MFRIGFFLIAWHLLSACTGFKSVSIHDLSQTLKSSDTYVQLSQNELLRFPLPEVQPMLVALSEIFKVRGATINHSQGFFTLALQSGNELALSDDASLKWDAMVGFDLENYSNEGITVALRGFRVDDKDVKQFVLSLSEGSAFLKMADDSEVEFGMQPLMDFLAEHEAALKKMQNLSLRDAVQMLTWYGHSQSRQNRLQLPQILLQALLASFPEAFSGQKYTLTFDRFVNVQKTNQANYFYVSGMFAQFEGPFQTRFFPIQSVELGEDRVCMTAWVSILPRGRGKPRTECVGI